MGCLAKLAIGCLTLATAVHGQQTKLKMAAEEAIADRSHQPRTVEELSEDAAISIWASTIFVGLLLITLLLAPFVGALMVSFAFGALTSSTPITIPKALSGHNFLDTDPSILLSRLIMLHEAWQKFDVKDAQCRKRLICEMYAAKSDLGPTAQKVMKVMDYIIEMGVGNLPDSMLPLFKEYVDSVRAGNGMKECAIKFGKCPFSIDGRIVPPSGHLTRRRSARRQLDRQVTGRTGELSALGAMIITNFILLGILLIPAALAIPFGDSLTI